MTEWKAKRFWKTASVAEADGGYGIMLDARSLKTPGKKSLILPTRRMAEAIAVEWNAQGEDIQPLTMPVTRAANSAIERVAPQKTEVANMLAAYAETDLLSHRATDPVSLQERQAQAWDPLLDWAAETYGARLYVIEGIIAVKQPPESLKALSYLLHSFDSFHLTALHDLVAMSGSLILGLAVSQGRLDPDEAWRISRIDEEWQIEQWGRDEEADANASLKRDQFLQAHQFWRLAT
ncbi:MAG: ATP12 family protein [Roseicyclus sp.]